jgi:hypothetical protein
MTYKRVAWSMLGVAAGFGYGCLVNYIEESRLWTWAVFAEFLGDTAHAWMFVLGVFTFHLSLTAIATLWAARSIARRGALTLGSGLLVGAALSLWGFVLLAVWSYYAHPAHSFGGFMA